MVVMRAGIVGMVLCLLLACSRSSTERYSSADVILASNARMEALRSALARGSEHHTTVLAALQEQVLSEDLQYFDRTETNWNYARSYLAQAAAFLYRLSGEQRYADIAFRALAAVYEDIDPDRRLPESGRHGLSRATVGLGFALAYAWCSEAWNDDQRQFVREAVHRGFAMWQDFRHVNLGSMRGSNWVSVCRGSELMQILAMGEQEQRQDRYEFLVQELSHHIRNGFDGIGATQEGIGYTDYGSIFLLPAVIAAADAGDQRLLNLLRSHSPDLHHKPAFAHAMAAVPAQHERLAGRNVVLYSGVGGLAAGNQGWGSLLFGVIPVDEIPYLRWWYDRTLGTLRAQGAGHTTHIEPFRQAAIWALLFYAQESADDPQGHWPLMVSGEKGRHYIRQRWRDERDIMLNIHAQSTFHSRAWAMIELGQWSLYAYGRMLVGGPRMERSGHQHSMLMVDGRMGSRRDLGRVLSTEVDEQTASLIIDGDAYYRSLGIESYQRHLLAHFAPVDDNAAVLALLDRIDSYQSHEFTWGIPIVDPDVAIHIDNDREAPQLILSSPEGGQLTLWLFGPDSAQWQEEAGRVWFSAQGFSGEFLLAMSLRDDAAGELVELAADRSHRHLRIDGVDLIHDRIADRLLVGEQAREWQKPTQAPTLMGLEAQVAADGSIDLRWFRRDEALTALYLETRSDPQASFTRQTSIGLDQRSLRLNGLDSGATYELRLLGVYDDGQEVPSATVTVTIGDHMNSVDEPDE